MNRRRFLQHTAVAALAAPWLGSPSFAASEGSSTPWIEPDRAKDWLARWERRILGDERERYCDKEMGEELGWLVSPFLNGFYSGYLATRDEKWIALSTDWTDACLRRAVREPDGLPGWPKGDGGGGKSKDFDADSLLGEAMFFRAVVLLADLIRKTPALSTRWGDRAARYLGLAEENFRKWDARGAWREVKDGGLWVVPGFGIDAAGKWSEGYARRDTDGFSNPANKQNHIARWLLTLNDTIKAPVYRERAEKWFRVMKSRIRPQHDGKHLVWNYWDPAGPWDRRPDGSLKHWVGVHPNGGYYGIDVEGIVAAIEHGLVFDRGDLDRLIATNRDFMWDQHLKGAKFGRIDGGETDPRWKNSPGVLWTALLPYDGTLRKVFAENHDPASWGGLATTPWFLSLAQKV